MRQPNEIIRTLLAAGYPAYFVGGCVRDRLLGRDIHDWDIATAAPAQTVLTLFEHCIPTGLAHGTVTVLLPDCSAEVTTFRSDGAYLDGRHPQQVCFVSSLAEDLSRRDFTVNAMAMALDGTITDLFGGREDLAHGILRCVGDPETRFREDALRMLRAMRFAAQLGFEIEPHTLRALTRCAPLCRALSAERIRDEAEKTLLSPQPTFLQTMAELGLLQSVGITSSAPTDSLSRLPLDAAVRWTAWKRLCPQLEPERLRLSGKLCDLITHAAQACCENPDRLALKQCICTHGWEAAQIVAAVCGVQPLLDDIRTSGECVSLQQLAVRGSDFPALQGADIGKTLHGLLQHVLLHPEDNERTLLLQLAEKSNF